MEKLILIIKNIANVIIENKEYLTDLDRQIGDGDHGTNLARGFEKILEDINSLENKSASEIMNKIAMTLISNVGGASGAIYGTAFMKAGQFLKDKDINDSKTIEGIWLAMIQGIEARGSSKLGEKTMLDTIIPAYEGFKTSIDKGDDIKTAFDNATKMAEKGMENTKNIIATKGRASYLGERSKGHIDPGAASSYLMIKTIASSI